MQEQEAMDPVEFRFTYSEDIELYGDGWYLYSEVDLIRLPARELIELEGQLGMPLPDVMNGMRLSTVLGDTAASWLGVRAARADLAGPFDEFNPRTMLITWRKATPGKDQEPMAPEETEPAMPELEGADFLGPDPRLPRRSDLADTVVLSTSPTSGYGR